MVAEIGADKAQGSERNAAVATYCKLSESTGNAVSVDLCTTSAEVWSESAKLKAIGVQRYVES